MPQVTGALADRVLSPPEADENVQWRIQANRAVLAEIREAPLLGVGFGREVDFFMNIEDPVTGVARPQQFEIGQDPHNGYLFLWAGGGLAALGTFPLFPFFLFCAFLRFLALEQSYVGNVNRPFAFGDFAARIVLRFAEVLFDNANAFDQHPLLSWKHC